MKSIVLALLLTGIGMGSALADAAGTYGTREPATCTSRSEPTGGGPPSAEQAARYVACELEKESGRQMYLISNVKVQVATTGRAYDIRSDNATDPDPNKPVYDIRGSFLSYYCSPKDSLEWTQHPGNACAYADQTEAKGICYINTYGEWHCTMFDPMHYLTSAYHQPPPN